VASTVVGGGIGERAWILNLQVPSDYARKDPADHVRLVGAELGCTGPGVGFLTAAAVERFTERVIDGVEAYATVGLQHPVWAADGTAVAGARGPGTINLVVVVPRGLSDGALVNAVATATEAKVQALVECGVAGTGTASDAVCVVAPTGGPVDEFGGPRSRLGVPLARAVLGAVADGVDRWWADVARP
jgi:adenosylcobinamide hydrolase